MLIVFFHVRKINISCVTFGLVFFVWNSLEWYMRIKSVSILTFWFLKEKQISECASLNQSPEVN